MQKLFKKIFMVTIRAPHIQADGGEPGIQKNL